MARSPGWRPSARRLATWIIPGFALLLVMMALGACGDEDRTQTDYTASADKNSVSADDSAATPAPAAPPADDTAPQPTPPQLAFAVPLAPLGTATVRGAAQVKSVSASTSIATALAGAVAGATYEGAVREGACSRMGATVAPLVPATADSLGAGRSSSDVTVSTDSLTKRAHVIVFGRGGRPEICGPIPSRASATAAFVTRPSPPPPSSPSATKADTSAKDTTRTRD